MREVSQTGEDSIFCHWESGYYKWPIYSICWAWLFKRYPKLQYLCQHLHYSVTTIKRTVHWTPTTNHKPPSWWYKLHYYYSPAAMSHLKYSTTKRNISIYCYNRCGKYNNKWKLEIFKIPRGFLNGVTLFSLLTESPP